mgnify:FL=1
MIIQKEHFAKRRESYVYLKHVLKDEQMKDKINKIVDCIVCILIIVSLLIKKYRRKITIVLLIIPSIVVGSSETNKSYYGSAIHCKTVLVKEKTYDKWKTFIKALIQVESRGDSNAVGTKDDVGVLQITPVYVKEVNRILGRDEYHLNDRYSSVKSLQMFGILQDYYNPNHSIEKAIKLHNPTANIDYHDKIINKIKEIKDASI